MIFIYNFLKSNKVLKYIFLIHESTEYKKIKGEPGQPGRPGNEGPPGRPGACGDKGEKGISIVTEVKGKRFINQFEVLNANY